MHTQDVDEELVAAATEVARTRCRGDNHTMAAAARTTDGRIVTGVNAYHFTGGPCAELVVVGTAAAQGAHDLETIVAVGDHDCGVVPPPVRSLPPGPPRLFPRAQGHRRHPRRPPRPSRHRPPPAHLRLGRPPARHAVAVRADAAGVKTRHAERSRRTQEFAHPLRLGTDARLPVRQDDRRRRLVPVRDRPYRRRGGRLAPDAGPVRPPRVPAQREARPPALAASRPPVDHRTPDRGAPAPGLLRAGGGREDQR